MTSHEEWDELVGRSLWMDACRDAITRCPQLLLTWAQDPSRCWVLDRLEGSEWCSDDEVIGESTRALHVLWLAVRATGTHEQDPTDAKWRGKLSCMVDSWAAANTLPLDRTEDGADRRAVTGLTRSAADSMIELQALWLAGHDLSPTRRREIGVVFESAKTGQGLTGSLRMEIFAGGPPGLFPHPRTMSLFSADPEFRRALTNAWTFQTRGHDKVPCLLWQLRIDDHRGNRVIGGSLGAALAVLLRELLGPPRPGALAASRVVARGRALSGWLRQPYGDYAVTGDVTEDGKLAKVGGLEAKISCARASGLTLVAPRANEPEMTNGEHVLWVDDVQQARRRLYRLHRVRTFGLAATIAVLAAATTAFLYTVQREENLQQSNLLLSRLLAAQSLDHYDTEPRKSIILALAAWTAAPSAEARGALLTAHGHLLDDRVPDYGTSISELTFSPDGRVLAMVGDDHQVRLWNRASRTLMATLAGHTAVFSPDSSMIATTSDDRTVRLWSATTGASLARLDAHGNARPSLSFSSDSRLLAAAGGDVRVWRTDTHHLLATLKVKGTTAALFQPATHVLVVMGKRVEAFDVATRPSIQRIGTLRNKGYSPSQISVDPDGTIQVAATAADADRWGTGPAKGWLPAAPVVGAVSPRGDVVATKDYVSFGGPPITLWSVANGNPIAALSGFSAEPGAMTFSPDGQTLAVVDKGRTVALLPTGLSNATLAPNPAINDIAFGMHGQMALSGGGDGTISWWNPSQRTMGQAQVLAHRRGVRAVLISPDGATAVSAGNDGTAKVWDRMSRHPKATLTGHNRPIVAMAFSRDGRTMVTADQGDNAILWNGRTFQMLRRLSSETLSNWGMPLILTAVAFSPDGHTLMAAGAGGAIVLVDLDGQGATGLLANFGGFIERIRDITVRPDGNAIISADVDGGITEWDITQINAGRTRTANGNQVTAGGVDSNSVAYSPDGATIAIARTDRTIMLMDAITHREVGTLRGHSGAVLALAYRPDGHRLLSADTNGVVREWNLDPGQAVSELCSVLQPSSWNSYGLENADGWSDFTARFSLPDTCHWPSSKTGS